MKVEEAALRIRPWGLRTSARDLEPMHDDLVLLIRRAAYVDEIRSVALRARKIGYAIILLGLMTFVWAAWRGPGVHSELAHSAEAAIVLGWALFIYVMFKRTRYVRAHPFDPER